ncbi:cell division protein FtsQ [Bacteroides sp. OttesenSCG-928-F21]|nr:cell division protein FtsQ [Bacteroides sp. OttesenSCG-928-F21]
MIKKILLLLLILLIGAYLLIAITAFNVKPVNQLCQDIELEIKDSVNTGFVTKKEITSILKKHNLYPVGKEMETIQSELLEEKLAAHPLIDKVECYKSPSAKLCIEVSQRIPILRVMSRNGENYYIDNKGAVLPPEAKCVANLVIITGQVEKSFAMKELYQFGLFLQRNRFWNGQIEQVNVLPGKEIELVPRVGDHIIFLGKLTNYEGKLDRVKEFYRKGLNKVGWNKYKRINVEFENQIICTKKEI